jgi:hypothetical protein
MIFLAFMLEFCILMPMNFIRMEKKMRKKRGSKADIARILLLIAIIELIAGLGRYNSVFGSQQAIPNKIGQVFVIDNWDNVITKNDLGFNYFSGNTGAVELVRETTSITESNNSNGSVGGSLDISYAFTDVNNEYAGYFASLFGLTDTKITLDGNSVEPNTSTPFPGYFLDTQDIYRGFSMFPNRNVEELRFDVLLESSDDIIIKVELKDENDIDVFAYCLVTNTGETWQTYSLGIPENFYDETGRFNWRQVSTFAIIVEHNNVGAGVHNPDSGRFLIDNLVLVDTDGNYPDINQIQSSSGGLDPNYQDAFLDLIRATSCLYFLDWASTDPRIGGIVQDRSMFADLMTVGGVGFQLSSYIIDAEQGYLSREDAALRVRNILRVLYNHPQGANRVGTIGYKGFFYHFLGIDGLRKQNFDFKDTNDINESLNTVELSTIDTALAIAGVVTAGQYFNGSSDVENEIRNLASQIYSRVDWKFMLNDNRFTNTKQFFLGWKPNEPRDDDSGHFGRFKLNDDPCNPKGQYSSKKDNNGVEIPATLDYYTDEGLLIALLAMGSPDPNHRLGREVWDAMIREDENGPFVKTYPGSLFTYQFASVWLNTQWLGSDTHHTKPINFFENTREAIQATRNYAIANPKGHTTLNENRWGLSATEGPFDSYFAEAAPPAAIHPGGNEPMAYVFGSSETFLREAENGTGDGVNHDRSNASNLQARWLHAGETCVLDFNLSGTAAYDVNVRYSNDGPADTVQISIDGQPVGAPFVTEDTRPPGGCSGCGWDNFFASDILGNINVAPGHHEVLVTVVQADSYGVEIDFVKLEPKPVLRPLEVGTVTNYGIGSSIVHTPTEAIAGLWNNAQHEDLNLDGTPDLLHPRFGFADAFNLNVADAVIAGAVHPNEPWVLRAEGAWVNYTGFAIDHGPMLIMIDNYLNGQFIPRLFMSHPNINNALSELFMFGDLNNDNNVDFADLMIFAGQWLLTTQNLSADFNIDGRVDFVDFAIFASHWLEGTSP